MQSLNYQSRQYEKITYNKAPYSNNFTLHSKLLVRVALKFKENGYSSMKYRCLLIENTNQQAIDAEIIYLKNELEVSLPDDYKSFLKSYNGGYLEYDIDQFR